MADCAEFEVFTPVIIIIIIIIITVYVYFQVKLIDVHPVVLE
jgi:hypothetical protein